MRMALPADDIPVSETSSPFDRIVDRYQHRVFRLVWSILGTGARDTDAEDVTQEVFLQVYRNLDRFREESQLGTWIYSIARNKALDRRRTARNRHPHVPVQPDWGSGHTDVEKNLQIAQAIEKLPQIYRVLIHLFYWQQASLEEISEVTGMKVGTIKSYLARARHNLEAVLHERK